MEVNNMIKLKKLLNEQKPFNLSYEEAKVKYLNDILKALKKAGFKPKKTQVMKQSFIHSKSIVGYFITIDKEIVLPLEVRTDGNLYYEIEKSYNLGKLANINKIAIAFKKLSKMDGWGQGRLVKKEEKITEGKADQSFNKIMNLLRKESRRLNDDDAYELSTKLKAWFNRHIL